MAIVKFFEKPGCINNTRQKAWLIESGHEVEARDLLAESWRVDRLLLFLGGLPVSEWFNRSAPAITSGAVDPDRLTAKEALELMCEEPLLIRRPLMQVGDDRRVGFDAAAVADWIGLTAENKGDIENCPRKQGSCD